MICTKQVASLLKLRRRYGPGQDHGGIGPDKIHYYDFNDTIYIYCEYLSVEITLMALTSTMTMLN